MKAPYFSIIIPTHQRAPLLRRTIASLRENDFKDIQLIVVADECDADTMAVAALLKRKMSSSMRMNRGRSKLRRCANTVFRFVPAHSMFSSGRQTEKDMSDSTVSTSLSMVVDKG